MFVYFDTLKSDHEVADTKLVELVANSNIASNKTVMVRSPSGYIDIISPKIFHFKF